MAIKIQTIKDIRLHLATELEKIYDGPEISAITNIIIKTTIGVTRLQMFYLPEQIISIEQAEKILEICKELKTGKPLQYIIGETDFYNCKIKLNNATLIPRPETEELVDLIIKENTNYSGSIIDLGTGSGCIAVALAANIPGSLVTGTDISDEAISAAQENARLNNVKVIFETGDIFSTEQDWGTKYGIIVSNPPYIRNSEKMHMSKNVLDFEPHKALFVPDTDPLVYYKAIIRFAELKLVKFGRIYFEINEALGKQTTQLLELEGYTGIEIIRDINNKERIVKGIKNV